MIECRSNGYVRGDQTSSYEVILDKQYTVKEFIEEVLTNRSGEWGYIGIYSKNAFFGKPNCEYKWGKLITEPLPEKYMNKVIKEVKGDGGWTRMDYILKLK